MASTHHLPLRVVAAVGLEVRERPMNGAEARAVNAVLRFLGSPASGPGHGLRRQPHAPSSDEALHAVAFLAERADRALGAGYRGDDVARCWPTVAARITAPPPADPDCAVCGRAKVRDAGGYLVCPDDSDEHAERAAALRRT